VDRQLRALFYWCRWMCLFIHAAKINNIRVNTEKEEQQFSKRHLFFKKIEEETSHFYVSTHNIYVRKKSN
jgi:hypothetical protein